jgi:kynureninase
MADNLIAVLRAVTDEQNTLKDEIDSTFDIIDIEIASNGDLDRIGEIVGEPKRSKDENGIYDISDLDYRANIYTKIELNASNGEREVIIKAVKRYTGSSDVQIVENNAEMIIRATTVLTQDELQQVKDVIAAGVGLYFIGVPATPFQYDTGLGYDIGEYASVLTIKGAK